MAAHRYWKIGDLPAGAGGYVAGAECYLRQTVGGTNEVPTASTGSAPYSSGPDVLYDGNPATWWASNAAPMFVAFDYGAPIDVAEIYFQARPDEHGQAPATANLYYSDTGLSGPWTPRGSVTFAPWTTDGQVQTVAIDLIPPGISVSEQAGYAALRPPAGLFLSDQAGYAALRPPAGLFLSDQAGYVVLLAQSGPTGPRRQPLPVGGF